VGIAIEKWAQSPVVSFPFLIGKVLTCIVKLADKISYIMRDTFPFLIGKVLTSVRLTHYFPFLLMYRFHSL